MKRGLSLARIAAVALVIAAGAQLTFAQSGRQRGSAQKDAVAETGPVSRPVNSGALIVPSGGLTAIPLTEAECSGIGGKVIQVQASNCESGKMCLTANADNTVHHRCISKQQ